MNKKHLDFKKYEDQTVLNEYDYSDEQLEKLKLLESDGLDETKFEGFKSLLESKNKNEI